MNNLKLKIITPKKVVLETEITSITLPSSQGEITILPRHIPIFALLTEGVVKYKTPSSEEFLAIGGGYVECDGDLIQLLVSRAYGQDEIDEKATKEAINSAKEDLKTVKNRDKIEEASTVLRRSLIDLKLLKKKAPKSFTGTPTDPS